MKSKVIWIEELQMEKIQNLCMVYLEIVFYNGKGHVNHMLENRWTKKITE